MLSRTRSVSFSDKIAYCNQTGVPGAFVECGVWKGGTVALMAYLSRARNDDRRPIHLFDAFQDISPPPPIPKSTARKH